VFVQVTWPGSMHNSSEKLELPLEYRKYTEDSVPVNPTTDIERLS